MDVGNKMKIILFFSRKSIIDTSQTPQEFTYTDPAVRPSSDSDATPIGAVTPASSPSSSLSARCTKQDVFVEPKPVQATVSNSKPNGLLYISY